MFLIGLAFAGCLARAQFNGPAPLSWRWSQPTPVVPTSSPIVSGDVLYLSFGPRIYALDRSTGNTLWRFPAGVAGTALFKEAPVLVGDTLLALGSNRTVYALNSATGKQRWQRLLIANALTNVVVAGNLAVVGLTDNTFIALSLATGEDAWQDPFKIPAPADATIYGSTASNAKTYERIVGDIASYGTTILAFNAESELLGISATSAKVLWRQRFTFVSPDVVPVVFGDTVYVATGTFLAAVNTLTGTAKWQQDLGESIAFKPGVSSSGVAVVSRQGKLAAFDLAGRPLLREPIATGTYPVAEPTVIGTDVLLPATSGHLLLLDTRTSSTRWVFTIKPVTGKIAVASAGGTTTFSNVVSASGPAIVASGTLLVMVKDGSLLAFDKQTGVDLTPPEVKMVWPNPGDQISGRLPMTFYFEIEDEASGIDPKTLKFTVDGKTVESERNKDGRYLVKLHITQENRPLREGKHTITVQAVDWSGNRAEETFILMVDNTLQPLGQPVLGPQPGDTGGGGGGGRGGRGGG
ncbi:MAG: PQQ-binding-like beta-propeller repeat protein [Fimbriimonas ginsengisoli]|uniref:PQQ-binding-like beta-propeller repeat protein n=1 Tax=Fimbriimonas ginsengisoli TaxID=1005039 RepID=A0A931LVA2_FIMGI|nr:PQQ-binding-like beta-propeller repeat protein [Fimbriimonas ginsengisoli]MBI3722000.1 PQQ-binding-like beta-propeller repeat protein [Fimbriimonas ginsengisoli]